MRLTFAHLSRYPRVFRHMTGLTFAEFEDLVRDVLPRFTAHEHQRLSRPTRRRAIGGGKHFALTPRDQCLLTVIWLRLYPMQEALGFLFGVTHYTVGRVLKRMVPLLEAAGRDTMRMPDPGKKQRPSLDHLLEDTPELAVVIDTFEQAVQRPKDHAAADATYSGKKKQHTQKTQVAVDETTGSFVDVAPPARGPTADLTVLKESHLLERLPPGVGAIGDLAYVGMAEAHPAGLGAAPRRKPRGQERPAEDVAYNRAFARRRIVVEHSIRRLRCSQALSQRDRHHRGHAGRAVAVAGLVNRCLGRKRR
jgi:hypothetical protein